MIFTTSVTTLGRDQRCAALCGAVRIRQDNNRRYVRGQKKKKNPPLVWYKQSNIYEIFHGKYMIFMHE